MKIVVLVKQVPVTVRVEFDKEKGLLIREGMESELNPLDLYAVEEAIRIKERLGDDVEIIALSMGPQMAVKAVKDAIAMGCDKGYLLSDKKFAGSDTQATSYALSMGIKMIEKSFDIILCGEKATDSETGQVGPGIAAHLGIPVLNYISKIAEIEAGKVIVHRAVEGGHEVLEAFTPVIVSVIKEINEPRYTTLKGKIRAKKTEVPVLSAGDIGADEDRLGTKGSLTSVVDTFYPEATRRGEIIYATKDLDEAVNSLVDFLKSQKCLMRSNNGK